MNSFVRCWSAVVRGMWNKPDGRRLDSKLEHIGPEQGLIQAAACPMQAIGPARRRIFLWPTALGVLAAALLWAAPARAWEKGPLSDYHDRRVRAVQGTGDGVVVLFGYSEDQIAISTTSFRQNEMFYYLTGWNEPDGILLLVPKEGTTTGKAGAEMGKEILFLPPRDPRQEKWTGPKLGPDDADVAARTGFPSVESATRFPVELREALKGFSRIYTELSPQPESGEDHFIEEKAAMLRQFAPQAKLGDIRPVLTQMRMAKSPEEIALIRKAVDASVEAHLAAMRAVRPEVWEYQIASLMEYEFGRRGCEWPSYPPIVGSGFFSTVLHYDQDDHQMKAGDVVVMDVGGSFSGYTSDITRTLPVNGRFTPRQREIYEIVLGAQNAVMAAARPGMFLGRGRSNSLQTVAYNYINSHGRDLHGKRLGQYFIHGIGHHIGLNVHDASNYDTPLAPNMVITDEPGIYLPEENLGVRIEDDLLITPTGAEVLSGRLPRAVDEIEKIMAQH